ncbi:MAG: hypothetical protein IPM13_17165 [Phycisphaerales bacterium]|nr:hypothetical protein [Phycisphaerales bacterium]
MQVGGQESSRPALKLRAKSARGGGFLALRLDGVIDEHNGLAQIGAALGGGDAPPGVTLPGFACERSDCENALDDDEETYFGFVSQLPIATDPDRLLRLTDQARSLLASSGAAIALAPNPLDPHDNASPSRSQPLGGLGLGSAPRKSSDNLLAPSANPAPTAPTDAAPSVRDAGGDWLFIAAMAAMLAVLGVLIYLILTLE